MPTAPLARVALIGWALLAPVAAADVAFQPLADFGRGGAPNDVNADGVIAGTVRMADDSTTVPVIWSTPQSNPIELPNERGGAASAINSNGQVAGFEFRDGAFGVKAVLWESGEKFVLPDLGQSAYAYDINEAGVIVGTVTTENDEYLACRWVNRQLELLPVPAFTAEGQQVWSFARSINSEGVITGSIQGLQGTPSIALRWSPDGAVSEIVTDGLETKGISIDNGGSVLINGYFDGGYSRGPARVGRDGNTVVLPVPSELFGGAPATTMSRTGIVAGYCYGSDNERGFFIQAVAWPNDEFTRLELPAGMQWAFPTGVGNNGLVFGSVTDGVSGLSTPGYWALPVEPSLVQASGLSGARGDTVQLSASSARTQAGRNIGHSIAVTVDGVRVGQALTDGQGVARLDYTIPTGFDGSRMTVRFTDESGASATATLTVTASCTASDLDCNGVVDAGDLSLLLVEFGPCAGNAACPGDLDGSGSIDFGDVAILLLDWTS
jgi:hypothetical protein